jgi:hypothetical protein
MAGILQDWEWQASVQQIRIPKLLYQYKPENVKKVPFIPCNRKSDGVGADNNAATDDDNGSESFIHSLILTQNPK